MNNILKEQYSTLSAITKTIKKRKKNNFNYFSSTLTKNCIIHIKFYDMRKHYINLSNLKDTFFISEYDKYFSYKKSFFKEPKDILDYISQKNLPIILYDNTHGEEINIIKAYELFEKKY